MFQAYKIDREKDLLLATVISEDVLTLFSTAVTNSSFGFSKVEENPPTLAFEYQL